MGDQLGPTEGDGSVDSSLMTGGTCGAKQDGSKIEKIIYIYIYIYMALDRFAAYINLKISPVIVKNGPEKRPKYIYIYIHIHVQIFLNIVKETNTQGHYLSNHFSAAK